MNETKKHFYDCYDSTSKDIIEIEDIIQYYKKHRNYDYYQGNIYCPECRKAELIYVHGSKVQPYLRRKNKESIHLEECSYNYEYAKKKQILDYIDSLDDINISFKLDSLMNQLFLLDTNTDNNKDISNNTNEISNAMLFDVNEGKYIITKALQRKHLNSNFNSEDIGKIYAFYGKVTLKEVHHKIKDNVQEGYYYLRVINEHKKQKASLYRLGAIQELNENDLYKIVMIGKVTFNNKGFYGIDLVNYSAIKYSKY